MSLSFSKDRIRVLLLGGIHNSARVAFESDGYSNVEMLAQELTEDELIAKVKDIHILGIRSATNITKRVLDRSPKLVALGCFCIGTNQVEVKEAKLKGIPVFNAPYSNTRSVAELVIGQVILLMRGIPEKNAAMHIGQWPKSAKGSFEVRGKTLGIVGYGHIGTQVGVLAEAMGMHTLYYDIVPKLALGNARPARSLEELLRQSDIVTLHVPGGPSTKNMITEKHLAVMRKSGKLINAARGDIVDTNALAEALRSGHLSGAAIDVHPSEPTSVTQPFQSPLIGLPSVILTPHIGGSTLEAQENIGAEVAEKLIHFSNSGSTLGAVNMVELNLPPHPDKHRLLHMHKNQPGVMAAINDVFARSNRNISGQYLQTDPEMGYVVIDMDQKGSKEIYERIKSVPGTIRTRILY